jgi:hypothetical protein
MWSKMIGWFFGAWIVELAFLGLFLLGFFWWSEEYRKVARVVTAVLGIVALAIGIVAAVV